ncbi:interleukin-31 receptor subunit alpha [Ctenodactylus gundi]
MWTLALWLFPLFYKLSLTALPAKPENISCVLYYDKNLTCSWSPGKRTSNTNYTVDMFCINQRKRYTCEPKSSISTSCSFKYPTLPERCNITVDAQNPDGNIRSDVTYWQLDTIVKTEPPEILSVNPVLGVKKMVQIKWKIHELFLFPSDLKYILQFKAVNSTPWMEVNFSNVDVSEYNLTGLQASTRYIIALRCTKKKSSIWSEWSQEKMGMTEEEVPHCLDLWRVLRPPAANGSRLVWLLWKKARGAPLLEKTLGYNIWYFPENNTNLTETRNVTNQHLKLQLEGKAYQVFVTSYNSLGNSQETTLRIPDIHETSFRCIKVMHARLVQDQLVVEWQSSCLDVNAWMVEWFLEDLDSELSAYSWERVSQASNWTIQQDKLKPLSCYNISVYPKLGGEVGEPYSIQAYAKEGIPSEGPVSNVEDIGTKTVTITWKEIPKDKRHGFISNYTIFYQSEDGKEFSKTVNSSTLRYGLESLTQNTFYAVHVMASTRAGGFNGTKINFKTLSINVFEIVLITSLAGGGLLVLIILTVVSALRKPNKLTRLCCPDVPNPAKSSIATWRGDNFKDKVNMKKFDDEHTALKLCSVPGDIVDKLVINFEIFLAEASIEEDKSQQNILGGEKNEYVISPNRSDCSPGKSFEEPLVLTEIPCRNPQHQYLRIEEETSDITEELLSSGQSVGPDHLCEDKEANPYLKNSMTMREFLVPEKLPDHTKRED